MSDYLEIARRVLRDRSTAPANPNWRSEDVLRGSAVELWSDDAGALFIVADEDDARRLGEPRGSVYTADEVRRVVKIAEPEIVREIHHWKRTFNGRIREVRAR